MDWEWFSVSSSNVQAIAFQPEDTILVRFKDGSVYAYPGHGPDEFQAMLQASSPGGFVWARLRGTGEYRV